MRYSGILVFFVLTGCIGANQIYLLPGEERVVQGYPADITESGSVQAFKAFVRRERRFPFVKGDESLRQVLAECRHMKVRDTRANPQTTLTVLEVECGTRKLRVGSRYRGGKWTFWLANSTGGKRDDRGSVR